MGPCSCVTLKVKPSSDVPAWSFGGLPKADPDTIVGSYMNCASVSIAEVSIFSLWTQSLSCLEEHVAFAAMDSIVIEWHKLSCPVAQGCFVHVPILTAVRAHFSCFHGFYFCSQTRT